MKIAEFDITQHRLYSGTGDTKLDILLKVCKYNHPILFENREYAKRLQKEISDIEAEACSEVWDQLLYFEDLRNHFSYEQVSNFNVEGRSSLFFFFLNLSIIDPVKFSLNMIIGVDDNQFLSSFLIRYNADNLSLEDFHDYLIEKYGARNFQYITIKKLWTMSSALRDCFYEMQYEKTAEEIDFVRRIPGILTMNVERSKKSYQEYLNAYKIVNSENVLQVKRMLGSHYYAIWEKIIGEEESSKICERRFAISTYSESDAEFSKVYEFEIIKENSRKLVNIKHCKDVLTDYLMDLRVYNNIIRNRTKLDSDLKFGTMDDLPEKYYFLRGSRIQFYEDIIQIVQIMYGVDFVTARRIYREKMEPPYEVSNQEIQLMNLLKLHPRRTKGAAIFESLMSVDLKADMFEQLDNA